MGARPVILAFAIEVALVATTACTTEGAGASDERTDAEAPRVPNPPPRYVSSTSAPIDAGQSSAMVEPGGPVIIKCGGREPFTCVVDGMPVCSDRPCVPDCTRVGCVGADVCTACDGGWVCRAPGEGC
jgi:hypothetical protein